MKRTSLAVLMLALAILAFAAPAAQAQAPAPTTFRAVVGGERGRGADRSNLEGGAVRD